MTQSQNDNPYLQFLKVGRDTTLATETSPQSEIAEPTPVPPVDSPQVDDNPYYKYLYPENNTTAPAVESTDYDSKTAPLPMVTGDAAEHFIAGMVESLKQQPAIFGQGLQAYGDVTNSDTLRKLGKTAESAAMAPKQSFMSWNDINSLEDAKNWLAEQAGQGIGSTLPGIVSSMAGATGGAVIGGMIVPAGGEIPGAVIGGYLGAGSTAIPLNTGDLRQSLIQAGVDDKLASSQAAKWGIVLSIPDVVSMNNILSKWGIVAATREQAKKKVIQMLVEQAAKNGLLSTAKGIAKQTAKDIGHAAAEEGLTEAAQQAAQDAVVADTANKPFLTAENAADVLTAGIGGAFGGGTFSAPGATHVVHSGAREIRKAQAEAQTQQQNGSTPANQNAAEADTTQPEKITGSPLVDMMQKAKAEAEAQKPTPDDLAAAINNGTPLPGGDAATAATISKDLQDQGFQVGGTASQTTEDGEVHEGTVVSANIFDGNLEVTVVTPDGELRTLFGDNGKITGTPKPEAAQKPAINQNGINNTGEPPAPPPAAPPTTVTKPAKKSYADMDVNELTQRLAFVKQNAIQNGGWKRGSIKVRDAILEQLNTRFPEWNIPQKLDVATAADQVNTAPTDAQKEAGNYQKGHVSIQGLNISLENPAGSERSGTAPDGTPWSVTMPSHYGYIKRTTGADGEHVDVYVGGEPSSQKVYVVDQINPNDQTFDEHKVMIGFNSQGEAMSAYNGAFSDGRGTERAGAVTEMTMRQFKNWLKNGKTETPLAWKPAPKNETQPEAQTPANTETQITQPAAAETAPAAPEIKQGTVGMMVKEGEIVLTTTGRQTTPFPKMNHTTPRTAALSQIRATTWLMQNALDEARSRNDEFNARQFEAELKNPKNVPPASKDSAEFYLFDPAWKKLGRENVQAPAETTSTTSQPDLGRTDEQAGETAPATANPPASETTAEAQSESLNEKKDQTEAGQGENQDAEEQGTAEDVTNEGVQPPAGEVRVSNVDVRDSRGGEMFGVKTVKVGDTVVSAADINIYNGGVYVQNISTREGEGRKGYAKMLIDDLFREFPDEKIYVSSMTDKGSSFFKKNYNVADDGEITQKNQPPTKAKTEQNVPAMAEESQGGAEEQNAPPAKKRMEDVGVKLEGGRKDKTDIKKVPASEQARAIINQTKPSAAFAFTPRENATEGVKRFHQVLVEQVKNFSQYLKEESLIVDGQRSRYSSGKAPSWDTQVKMFFADNGGEPIKIGYYTFDADRQQGKRQMILKAADRYLNFANRITDVFENASTLEELRLELKNLVADEQFHKDLYEFTGKYSLASELVKDDGYGMFSRIKDETETKKPKRVEKTLTRPKIDLLERENLTDYRQGRDISSQEFKDTFGFRGVEFGNWVKAAEGQSHVNAAYEALMDLSKRLGIRPQDISLGGKLGFAFGARGSGEHAAHFEPDTNIINLTKTKGDGSVAHEWGHALDYNLRKTREGKRLMDSFYNSLSKKAQNMDWLEGQVKKFLEGRMWYSNINKDGEIANAKFYLNQIRNYPTERGMVTTDFQREGDALGKDYWGTQIELFARAWESHIFDTLEGRSPYLVNPWVAEGAVTIEQGYRGKPFPSGDERRTFSAAFDELFDRLVFDDEGVRLKDGVYDSDKEKFIKPTAFMQSVDNLKKLADDIEGRLGQMMKEIENGRIQQGQVQTGVSGRSGTPESTFVPQDDAGENADGQPQGRGESGGGDIQEAGGASTEEGIPSGTGESGGGGDRVSSDDTVPSDKAVKDAPESFEVQGENHVIGVGDLDEKRSQRQKAEDNLKIIDTVRKIEREVRAATPEEQQLLARYTGWGSVKNAFPDGEGRAKTEWEDVVRRVKDTLTDEEYRAARRSIQYAHYTSEIVTRSMWKAMQRLGLKDGNVFEPGMGIGNFAGTMPAELNLQYSGLEVDPMSARIAAILYPKYGVRQSDFVSAKYADGMFDAAIGNPPFSDQKVKGDSRYKNLSLHDYFFAKTADMIAPGGVVGFVTSRYSLDKIDNQARAELAKNMDLVGAIRLPNTAFKTNAHTEVVTDIIFLRKRRVGEESNGVKWLDVVDSHVEDDQGRPFKINEYFANNPEMILGNLSSEGTMYARGGLTVDPVEGHDLQQQLDEAIARLPEEVVNGTDRASTAGLDLNPEIKKDGSYYMKGDTLMQVENGIGQPVQMRGKSGGGMAKEDAAKVRLLIPIRDKLTAALNAMVANDASAMKEAQKTLKKDYDAFVKKYGAITKSETRSRPASPAQLEEARDELRNDYAEAGEEFNEGDIDLSALRNKINPATRKKYTAAQISAERRKRQDEIEAKGGVVDHGDFDPSTVPDNISVIYPNLDPFKGDPEYYNLLVLENYDSDTDTATPTDFFTKNIVGKRQTPEVKTSVDALNHSLAVRNTVDIDFMSKSLGMNRDTLIKELEELDLIYGLPMMGGGQKYFYSEEYLSGLVKDKLEYANRLAAKDPSYKRHVQALEAVQPRDIPASDINTQLGSPYFKPEVISDFMEKELGVPARVSYVGIINGWEVKAYDRTAAQNNSVHGTSARPADDLMASLLMRREVKVTKNVVDPATGKEKAVVDVDATQAAQDKAKALQERFDKWIWKSEHAERVHREYNDGFNNIVPRTFDGKHITVDSTIPPRPHQKTAVWRVLQTGNTYLAHAVGGGKTLEMVMSAMEMRRLGQWKKPMFVVPNHMLAQFAAEFRIAYPAAKIMVADEQNFHTDRRKRFVASVAKTDLDGVILTYSAFKKMSVSKEFEAEKIGEELDKYRSALEETNRTSGKKSATASRIEKQIQKMEMRLKALNVKEQDQGISFDQLGADAILLDEAHYFRKLSFATMQGSMKGVNPIGSKAAWDLYVKSKFLDTIHPGRNLVMASGTPLTNTLAEVYTIQRFMNEAALESRGISSFDAWSSVYAAPVTNAERQPSGAYKNVTRLAEFRNLKSLSQMVREFMDVVTSDELGQLVDRPTLKSGSMIIKTTAPTREYLAFQKYLADRMEKVAKTRGNKKGADNILSIIGEGRHAAIDMRLIDPTLTERPSKLEDMISNIAAVYRQTSEDQFKALDRNGKLTKDIHPTKGGAQLVFSDLGVRSRTKEGKTFSAYDHIRRKLIQSGIPAEQIAFIYDYDTTEQKRELQNKVRNGEIRILIGSTAKMGTGLNVQNRLKAVHNLDAPWLPADLEQRTGRALRQGNQYSEVEIYGYGTEGSYDSTMWGMLETKAKAIISFLKGDGDLNSMRDIEETDHFRMAKAMTSGDTRVIKQAELESEVEKLGRQATNFTNEQVKVKSDIARNRGRISSNEQLIEDIDAANKQKKDFAEDKFEMDVNGNPYTDRAEAGHALEKAVKAITSQNTAVDGAKIASYRGFDVLMSAIPSASNVDPRTEYEIYIDHPAFTASYENSNVWMGDEFSGGSGAISRLNNAVNRLSKAREDAVNGIERSKREIKTLESQISNDFPKQAELDRKKAELAEVNTDLKKNAPVEVMYDDYPLDYWRANKEAMNASTDADTSDGSFLILGDEDYDYADVRTLEAAGKTLELSQERDEVIQRKVNDRLRQLGFPAANFRLYSHQDQLQPLYGMPDNVQGFYWKGLVYVAQEAKDIISTLNHEVIHALRASGAFTEAEWNILRGRAAEWRAKYNIDKTYAPVLTERGVIDQQTLDQKLDEEAIAHAFQDHANMGIIRRIANKIVRFVKGIASALRGQGFQSAESVFDAVGRGEVAARFSNVSVVPENGQKQASFSITVQREKTFDPAEEQKKVADIVNSEIGEYSEYNSKYAFISVDGAVKRRKVKDINIRYFKPWSSGFYVGTDGVLYHGDGTRKSPMIAATDEQKAALKTNIEKYFNDVRGDSRKRAARFEPDIEEIARYADSKGFDVRIVHPEDTSSRYIYLSKNGGKETKIRLADHPQPTAWREDGTYGVVGGYSTKTGNRHAASDFSMESNGEYSLEKAKAFIDNLDDDFPMFSLSTDNDKAVNEASDVLATVRGLDRTLSNDISRAAATVLHPSQIASLHKEFAPVYQGFLNRNKTRDALIYSLSQHVEPYNNLDEEARARVDAVLELGRLEKTTFRPQGADGSLTVKNNDRESAVHSRPGQTIILSPDEVAAYKGVRNAMNEALDRFRATVLVDAGLWEKGIRNAQDVEKLRLQAIAAGNVNEVRRLKNVLEQMQDVDDAKKAGYIPFKRWGQIGISVKDGEGNILRFERVELPEGWQKRQGLIGEQPEVAEAIERLKKQYGNEEDVTISAFEMSKFDQVAAHISLRDLDILAAASELSDSDYQRLREALVKTQQQKGFRQHFFKAKDTPGYSEDFQRAINDYVVSISSYIARRTHDQTIEGLISSITSTGKARLYDYARKYQSYINDPQEEAQALRAAGFFWYLSGNISSGLVNATQPMLVTAPWLNSVFGHGDIFGQLTKAYGDVSKMLDIKKMGVDAFDPSKAPEDIRQALIDAYAEGDFISYNTNQEIALSNTPTQALRGMEKKKRKIMDAIGATFSVPEKMNRIVTYAAAYRLAKSSPEAREAIKRFVKNDHLGQTILAGQTTPEAFARAFAELAVVSTQFRMGKMNRPRIARGAIGTVSTQFMSYNFQVLELMWRLAKVNGEGSKKALGVMLLALIGMAGYKGIPFENDIKVMIEKLIGLMKNGKAPNIDAKIRKIVEQHTSPFVAEAILRGLPAAIGNLDLSYRVGLGDVLKMDKLTGDDPWSAAGVWYDMLISKPKRSIQFAEKGQYINSVAEISPAFARNMLQALSWQKNGVKTVGGKTVIPRDKLATSDILLKVFGFTSAHVSEERDKFYDRYVKKKK